MKYLYIIFSCALFVFSSQVVVAAEGDLVWASVSNYSAYGDGALGVATDGTGIYVVGADYALGSGNGQWRVEKRNKTDGAVIWTKVLNLSIYGEAAWGVAVDSTGVYIVGEDYAAGLGQWHMEKRSLVDGSLIWTQVNNFSNNREIAYKVEVDNTGLYIVGYDEALPSLNQRWHMQKRNLSTGALIWDQTSNPGVGGDQAKDVAIDGSGVYVVGTDSGVPGTWQMSVQKRNLLTGALIWNVTKIQTPAPLCGVGRVFNENSEGVNVDNTGVYIPGVGTACGFYSSNSILEKRNLLTGALIWSRTNPAPSVLTRILGSAINNSGLYLIGRESTADPYWRIEKRNLSTGLVEWSKISNPSPRDDYARDITVDGTGMYIVGHDDSLGSSTVSNWQWRIEKREVIPPPLPDLTADAITPTTATVGAPTLFSATIRNAGTAATGAIFTNLFQFDGDTNHAVVDGTQTATAGPLAVGGSENISASYTFPSSGPWHVSACADKNTLLAGTITESDEFNNCGPWIEVTVNALPSGTIIPANCTITSGVNCTALVGWTTTNVTSPDIKNNGVTFSTAPSSAGTSATLNYGLNTLTLYDGLTLLDTAFAFGVAADQGAGGPSCGGSFTSAPTTGLCASGTVSPVVPTGPGWGWTCGTGVGEVVCTATNIGPTCNNSVCEKGESLLSCPQDCGGKKIEQF